MGASHFKTRTLDKVRTEMSLHVLVYDLKRVVAMLGPQSLIEAIQALNGPAIPGAENTNQPLHRSEKAAAAFTDPP